MKNYSFFSEWNTSKMLSLWELLRLSKIPKNSVIFKEGDESKCFFFIKAGEIEVIYKNSMVFVDISYYYFM
jgi:CRP-like cAMP-binding protein